MKTAILSALALLSIAGSAWAAPPTPDAPPTVSISYADLDLSQARDAAIMLSRIQRAAAAACRKAPGLAGNDTETILRVEACYRQALGRAVAGLDAPKVTQAFAERPIRQRLARLP